MIAAAANALAYENVPIEEAISRYFAACRAERKSEHTLSAYAYQLGLFASTFPRRSVSSFTIEDLEAFLAAQTTVSKKTVFNYHTALSAFFGWAKKRKLCAENLAREVEPPRPEERQIVPFAFHEIQLLLDACDYSVPYKRGFDSMTTCHSTLNGLRDRAILLLLLDTGLRASELCGLKFSDLNYPQLRVMGKRDKERYVPFSSIAMSAMQKYWATRKDLESKARVFTTLAGKPLNRGSLLDVMERLEARCGVPDVHPHRLRHTFAITYLRNGGDIYTLQKILGHSSLDMVKRYLAIAQCDVQAMHAKASPLANWVLD